MFKRVSEGGASVPCGISVNGTRREVSQAGDPEG